MNAGKALCSLAIGMIVVMLIAGPVNAQGPVGRAIRVAQSNADARRSAADAALAARQNNNRQNFNTVRVSSHHGHAQRVAIPLAVQAPVHLSAVPVQLQAIPYAAPPVQLQAVPQAQVQLQAAPTTTTTTTTTTTQVGSTVQIQAAPVQLPAAPPVLLQSQPVLLQSQPVFGVPIYGQPVFGIPPGHCQTFGSSRCR